MVDVDDSRLEVAKKFGATHCVNSAKEDAVTKIRELTNNVGVDVAMEAVGIPATFNVCQGIVAVGGHIANIGVHGKSTELHLEDLWIKNITITADLVNANSTATLLKIVESKKIEPKQLITHHFTLNEVEKAYEVFGNASVNKALKVIISNS